MAQSSTSQWMYPSSPIEFDMNNTLSIRRDINSHSGLLIAEFTIDGCSRPHSQTPAPKLSQSNPTNTICTSDAFFYALPSSLPSTRFVSNIPPIPLNAPNCILPHKPLIIDHLGDPASWLDARNMPLLGPRIGNRLAPPLGSRRYLSDANGCGMMLQ